jgi:hypothetical protein
METLNMMRLQDQTLQEVILPNQVLPKHLLRQIFPQAGRWPLNFSVVFLKLQTGKQKQMLLKRKEVRQSCLISRWKQPYELRRNRDKSRQVTKGKHITREARGAFW